jgi:parallel beta-helix repeat protein
MKNTQLTKPIITIILYIILFSPLQTTISTAQHTSMTLYVDDDYTSDTPGWGTTRFAMIQSAINTAATGDTIIIFEGHYPETLTIDKTISIRGNSTSSVIINGTAYSEALITITANDVTLSQVTIQGKGQAYYPRLSCILCKGDHTTITDVDSYDTDYVITLRGSNNNIITGNHLYGFHLNGFLMDDSHDNDISNNTIHGTYGVEARNSNHNIIRDNNIRGHQGYVSYCILLLSSSDNLIYNNIISATFMGLYIAGTTNTNIQKNTITIESGVIGLYLDSSTQCSVIENTIQGDNENEYGIWIDNTQKSTIIRNTITQSQQGVLFEKATENTMTENIISGNIQGIMMKTCKDNILKENNIHDNFYGIKLRFSGSNTIYNNIFSNEKNVEVDFLGLFSWNRWNIKKTGGENIIGGDYLGGNYWGGPRGYTGHDYTNDGIGERWYFMGFTGIDFAPLVDHE